jgi:hypothetical protein
VWFNKTTRWCRLPLLLTTLYNQPSEYIQSRHHGLESVRATIGPGNYSYRSNLPTGHAKWWPNDYIIINVEDEQSNPPFNVTGGIPWITPLT